MGLDFKTSRPTPSDLLPLARLPSLAGSFQATPPPGNPGVQTHKPVGDILQSNRSTSITHQAPRLLHADMGSDLAWRVLGRQWSAMHTLAVALWMKFSWDAVMPLACMWSVAAFTLCCLLNDDSRYHCDPCRRRWLTPGKGCAGMGLRCVGLDGRMV